MLCVNSKLRWTCGRVLRWRFGSRTGEWSGNVWREASRGQQLDRKNWWTWKKGSYYRQSSPGWWRCHILGIRRRPPRTTARTATTAQTLTRYGPVNKNPRKQHTIRRDPLQTVEGCCQTSDNNQPNKLGFDLSNLSNVLCSLWTPQSMFVCMKLYMYGITTRVYLPLSIHACILSTNKWEKQKIKPFDVWESMWNLTEENMLTHHSGDTNDPFSFITTMWQWPRLHLGAQKHHL